jgi:hypothetical protein
MDVDTLSTLGGVVLGAVLAILGGVWTERWKQRQALRAAARLVWFEVMLGYSLLLGAIALERWPGKVVVWDDAWKSQRDRLALGLATEDFQELQTLFLVMRDIAERKDQARSEPVLYWQVLEVADRLVGTLGEIGRVEKEQLSALVGMPLEYRVTQMRDQTRRLLTPDATDEGRDELIRQALESQALESFPPAMRARAAEALTQHYARLGHRAAKPPE